MGGGGLGYASTTTSSSPTRALLQRALPAGRQAGGPRGHRQRRRALPGKRTASARTRAARRRASTPPSPSTCPRPRRRRRSGRPPGSLSGPRRRGLLLPRWWRSCGTGCAPSMAQYCLGSAAPSRKYETQLASRRHAREHCGCRACSYKNVAAILKKTTWTESRLRSSRELTALPPRQRVAARTTTAEVLKSTEKVASRCSGRPQRAACAPAAMTQQAHHDSPPGCRTSTHACRADLEKLGR